jgi:hypothetical protein
LRVYSFANAEGSEEAGLELGTHIAEIKEAKVVAAFDECVRGSHPTHATKPPLPVANANWIVICRGDAQGVALHIFADGQIGWRYENAQVIEDVLRVKGSASNQLQTGQLAKLVVEQLRRTVPEVVRPYDMLNSNDPFTDK